ncbi:MAG: 1-deoxy-D-xylulose-5-phosphate synthase [Nitrospiraceae bacterium]
MAKIIDQIALPQGLRSLDLAALKQVTQELRDELIHTVSESGGHFASSLGAAEITVALHYVFETPHDRLVWDVGHQGYIHKMLTGRRVALGTVRQKDGLSGYLARAESEYDTFGAGHAGTSISAAVGMLEGLLKDDSDRKVVAIIGDGAMTAGMAFEALNHAGGLKRNLIVLLNDNEMSISPNVGGLSWRFSKAVTSKYSTRARTHLKNLHRKGYVPDIVYQLVDRAEEATQSFFASPAMLFEAFGFRYIGPIDGHKLEDLITALQHAKEQDIPVLVHAHTVKGKGYEPAEKAPVKWHAVQPFDKEKGEFRKSVAPPPTKKVPSYTEVFADSLIKIRQIDPKVVAITAAMSTGTGLDKFEKAFPNSFYDVAICEQHAVTFAAGLACEGYKPVVAIYPTFLQRAYDQLIHDVCIQNLPVVFAMDRAGAVGNDGHTHQGVFDISYLRAIPNMVIMAPRDENELQHMLYTAIEHHGPAALRYPRGSAAGVPIDDELRKLPIGRGEILHQGHDVLLLAIGPLVYTCLQVAERLESEYGVSASVLDAKFIKPLDRELLSQELPKYQIVCSLEDHGVQGGFGSVVLELVNDEGIALQAPIKRFGVADSFIPHGSQKEQYQMHGYDPETIYRSIVVSMLGPRERALARLR